MGRHTTNSVEIPDLNFFQLKDGRMVDKDNPNIWRTPDQAKLMLVEDLHAIIKWEWEMRTNATSSTEEEVF